MDIHTSHYGTLQGGRSVDCITLESERLVAKFITYGLRLISLELKSPDMSLQQLALGQWPLEVYEADTSYHGAIVGRTCNRISNSSFELNGNHYALQPNEGEHHLHGGINGFHNRVWDFVIDSETVRFTTHSPTGEAGYPGNCDVEVAVMLASDALVYEYSGRCDEDTLLDMTCHAYFCLDQTQSILDHELQLKATHFSPVGPDLIPTGELREVSGTSFDFRTAQPVGRSMKQPGTVASSEQLDIAGGYDHSWLFDEQTIDEPLACLYSPNSRIEMKVFTSQPAVQLYTGNHLEPAYAALCLETQHLPNACNQIGFSSPTLKAGEEYSQFTRFQFTMRGPSNDVELP